GHAGRHMPLQERPIMADFIVLGLDLVVQVIQSGGERYAMRADDNAVKTPSVFCIDRVPGKDVFADICAAKYHNVRWRSRLSVARKRGPVLAGKKGPAVWLRSVKVAVV